MPNDPANRPPTFDRLRSMKKPNLKRIDIFMDSEAAEGYESLKERVEELQQRQRMAPTESTAAELLHAENDLVKMMDKFRSEEGIVQTFVFRAIGRQKYDELVTQYPPTPEQQKEADDLQEQQHRGPGPFKPQALSFNTDTFPYALIARSMVSPVKIGEGGATEEDIIEWLRSDEWNDAEFSSLFFTAQMANSQRKVVTLGNA